MMKRKANPPVVITEKIVLVVNDASPYARVLSLKWLRPNPQSSGGSGVSAAGTAERYAQRTLFFMKEAVLICTRKKGRPLQRLLKYWNSSYGRGARFESTPGDPVPEEVLNKILDAGRYAPTGTNSQNVHYVVLTSPDQIAELQKRTIRFYDKIFSRVRGRFGMFLFSLVAGRKTAEYLRESLPKIEYANEQIKQGKDRLFYHAPVVMLAHAESWDTCSSFNCSVALYHCSLMAHTLGLGCCFNGFLVNAVNHAPKIKGWLGIPADHKCYSAMTVGFPDVKYLRLVRRYPPKVNKTP